MEQPIRSISNRNLIGDMRDNETVVKKAFVHLNNFKRSRSLMNQSFGDADKNRHELSMYHEIDNLELTLRTMQSNIRREKYTTSEESEEE